MDAQIAELLAGTQRPEEGPRKQAELDLIRAKTSPEFPLVLGRIGGNTSLPVEIRQSALTTLRKFTEDHWSPDGHDGREITIPPETKTKLRDGILQLVLDTEDQRKVKVAASYVVSKIAVVDFPDQWPDLLPTVLRILPTGTDAQLHGALRILQDLVEESLTDIQFVTVARDIIKACHEVALNVGRKFTHRSLAVLVFRSCFDLMDIVKEDNKEEVKQFADEVLREWLPFFLDVIQSPLPAAPTTQGQPDAWYGPIALKVQVVKTLIKVKLVFRSLLQAQSTQFFQATWDELIKLQESYRELFVEADAQGRLEDIDGLPYTLDFLVLDELDLLNQLLRAPPVQKELKAAIVQHNNEVHKTPWVLDLMKLLVSYSRITQEEEGLWEIDVSLYLAEETSVSSNYTARTACGDLLIKLGENIEAISGLYAYTSTLFYTGATDWRRQEAALYLFNALLSDFQEMDKTITDQVGDAYSQLIRYATSRADEPVLRARGFLAAGTLAQSYQPIAALLDDALKLMVDSEQSEIVQVACVKAVEGFIKAGVPPTRQSEIIISIKKFLDSRDLMDMDDADDLLATLLETIRAAINMDIRIALQPDNIALNLLFLVAKHGAGNFQVSGILTEAFEDIARTLTDPISYTAFCKNALPLLTGAIDVSNATGEESLVTLVTELLAVLIEHGSEPLPEGFVAAIFPRLSKLLLESNEGEVLRPGAEAVKYMLMHDHHQVFAWQNENGQTGLEVCLIIIDRLLGSTIEDNAASEVGGLAAELVEKAGQERLGPFLEQLLQAVAARLDTAQAEPFIQSLIIVFARLALPDAAPVVNFLSGIQVNGQSGLQVVLGKWLEHSVSFAGYDEIRQNVIALSKLFELNDSRIQETQVKGDLIIPASDRIMTRSRARLNPDQFTIIPAPLKIIKVLVEELLSASGLNAAANAASAVATAQFVDADSDDGDDAWEDEHDTLDLALGSTKADLMAWGESMSSRQRDDETQAYLVEFFVRAARENVAGFNAYFEMLSEDEKSKLRELAKEQ
ncbi:armadillo-type protein [Immersiella caudata]|uniref:Armadillo-type protein n=1 Tax=Immersiella caudata TaxID=314043 RepID=A0AA39WRK3_9PEZI|nr:armadillo-type protein [Immersiella caudata]